MPLFVAVGHQGQRIVSEDGSAWKNQALGGEGEVFRSAAVGGGVYVAVGTYGGNNILSSSSDGVTWKTLHKDGKYKYKLGCVAYGNGTFVAVGGEPVTVGAQSSFALHSKNGTDWSEIIPISGKFMLRRIAFGNNTWAGVGDRGRRAASADGKEWKDAADAKAIDTLVDVVFGNGVFAGVGLNSLRMRSADGLKWENKQLGEEGEHLNSVLFANGQFVALGLGATYTSPDAISWKRQSNSDAPLTMCFGNGLFAGVNWRGRILTSPDAVAWKQVHKSEHHFEAIAFG